MSGDVASRMGREDAAREGKSRFSNGEGIWTWATRQLCVGLFIRSGDISMIEVI